MTDSKQSNNCVFCMLFPLLLGAIALGVGFIALANDKALDIQNDLNLKSNQALNEHKIGGVQVNVDGRVATLTGQTVGKERVLKAEHVIASIPGIRRVDNHITYILPDEPSITRKEPSEPSKKTVTEPKAEPVVSAQLEESTQLAQQVAHQIKSLNLESITFLSDSDEITEESLVVLNDVVNVLEQHQEFNAVVEGHTDNVGDEDLNLNLSQRRAESVKNYLSNQGIEAERLTAIGYGSTRPIATNETVDGRALNRRIEFAVSRRH